MISKKLIKSLNKQNITFSNFWKKLFEPLIELEHRRNRFVLYLLGRQIINFDTKDIKVKYYNFKYSIQLAKIRFIARNRKIRVGFWLTESQKWSSFESTFKTLSKDSRFEVFVLLSNFKNKDTETNIKNLKNNKYFLDNHNIKYKITYDSKKNSFYSLQKFKPDIVFYQQPWGIPDNQAIKETSKFALTCYIPYCFYSLDNVINYLYGFHGCVWRYFVETKEHLEEYKRKYNAKNCISVGSTKLDKYKELEDIEVLRLKNKKRIIYAPHHTFLSEYNYQMATFAENGKLIQEYALNHPEFEWIFRPHPSFSEKLIQNNILSETEIENYYKKWESIGNIYTESDYYELFATSDCLITDCISFLAEYLPTGKPVIHLRSKKQNCKFNSLLQKITENYYKIYNNTELIKTLDSLLIENNDYLQKKRTDTINLLMVDKNKTAGEKIKDYLIKELHLKA